MHADEHSIPSSRWARNLAGFAVALVVSGGLFHRLFDMSTPLALNLFILAFALCGLAIGFGVVALVRVWRYGFQGAANAVAGLAIAILILSWPVSLVPRMQALPRINDITTDIQNPPPFVVLASQRPKGSNTADYPGPRTGEKQKQAYGDLQSLDVRRNAEEVFDLAALALRRLRMKVVSEQPSGPGGQDGGLIEAVDRTLIFGFYDDVAVRVTALGRGAARVDVRSASRYGQHDLGANAARIRTILNELVARIEASVPGQRLRR